MRCRAEALDRLVEPWLQRLDPELFPLKHPLDARLNAMVAEFLADPGGNAISQWLLPLVNTLLGWIGEAIDSYRTLFDKDALRRHAVPLGIDLDAHTGWCVRRAGGGIAAARTDRRGRAIGFRANSAWRYLDEAVVFSYTRTLPIDFGLFVRRVDIARTIQFMNDYLGGVVVALAHDASGRPVRQAERNIYLPQPNYLVLYQGKPIDVSKLEVVEYDTGRHRLFWKTVAERERLRHLR